MTNQFKLYAYCIILMSMHNIYAVNPNGAQSNTNNNFISVSNSHQPLNYNDTYDLALIAQQNQATPPAHNTNTATILENNVIIGIENGQEYIELVPHNRIYRQIAGTHHLQGLNNTLDSEIIDELLSSNNPLDDDLEDLLSDNNE